MMNKQYQANSMAKSHESHESNDLLDAQTSLNEHQMLLINDLAEGHLQGAEFANAMCLLNNSSHARAVWHRLHVVGDVMRSNELASCHNDSAFLQRVKLSLQKELVIQPMPVTSLKAMHVKDSANDRVFIWKSVAGFASLVGVVAVSWSLLNGAINGGTESGAGLASVPVNQAPLAVVAADTAVSSTTTGRGEMLRDAQLDAMIAAHKQLGGVLGFTSTVGFLASCDL